MNRIEVRSVDGTPPAVWVDGDGPPIVLVHGSIAERSRGTSKNTWPAGPNTSSSLGMIPSLANTGCTWALSPERKATNLAR